LLSMSRFANGAAYDIDHISASPTGHQESV
jgi:hypothetical protein